MSSSSIRLVRESQHELHFAHPYMAGAIVCAIGLGVSYFGLVRLEGEGLGRWMVTGFGAVFALVGLGATLWRFDLTFDLISRTYRGRRGFWPSPRLLGGSIDELSGLVFRHETRRSSNRRGRSREYDVWTVSLDFGDWSVRIHESQNQGTAHQRLEHLAKLLRVTVVDRTGDVESRRAWDEVDRTLADAARDRGGGTAPAPGPPPGGRIDWDPTHGISRIELPPLGFNVGTVFLLLFGLAFAAFAAAFLLALAGIWDVPVSGSRTSGWIVSTVFLLFGLAIMLGGLWASYARELIREEHDGLSFCLALLGKRYRQRFIVKREIEEVSTQTRRAGRRRAETRDVVVRSDAQLVKLGGSLTVEEQDWLRAALEHLVTR